MLETEKQVLANLSSVVNIRSILNRGMGKSYFTLTEHQKLFEGILYYYQEHDKILIADSLQLLLDQGTKTSTDLKKKIIVLYEEIKQLPKVSDFELLLDKFTGEYKLRLFRDALSKGVDIASDGNSDKAIGTTIAHLLDIQKNINPPTNTSGYFGEDADFLVQDYYDRKANPDKYRGIMLGFDRFDQATGGLRKGCVYLVMGAMKTAKSVLMVNIVRNVASKGKNVYYHVNEGGKRMPELRYISCETGIPYTHLRDSCMTSEEEVKYQNFLTNIKNTRNIYFDSVSPTQSKLSYLDAKLKELTAFQSVDLVVVDYLGLMTCEKKIESEWQKYGILVLDLKTLAMTHNVPIIVVHHVNRKGMETKKQSFDQEDLGLSLEPTKHVDATISWRIEDLEIFHKTNTGYGHLTISGARDSEGCDAVLEINTNVMKIKTLGEISLQ